VLKWPDKTTVDVAARRLAAQQTALHPELIRLGYFGSYARGDWGVGSDLDLIAIVSEADRPFAERGLDWDLSALPVPAEILVYTEAEWERMRAEGRRLPREIDAHCRWLTSVDG
jgi:predicted nucleotidyltransferase